jgi:hypothetical protein
MSQIFISYSRMDREFVDELIGQVENRGFDVWVDRKDIGGGKEWRAAISQAISECSFFMLVLSPNSVDSRKVTQEVSLADEQGRKIIPIRYQQCEVPHELNLQLAGLQWIDFVENSNEDAMEQLFRALGEKAASKPRQRPAGSSRNQPVPSSFPAVNPAAPAASPFQPAGAASLAHILPGTWQVQIMTPLGVMGTLTVELNPAGVFQGQLMKPTGMTAVQGQWQITPMNQIVMQGQETNGFMFLPYAVMIQIQQVLPNQLSGTSIAGEQVVWQKLQ